MIEIIGMGLAALGTIVAGAAGSVRFEDWRAEREMRRMVDFDHEVALLMDEQMESDAVVEISAPARCPVCKRFARVTEVGGSVVADCKAHGWVAEAVIDTGSMPIVIIPADALADAPPETSDFVIAHPSESAE